jgi:hypothetical protein
MDLPPRFAPRKGVNGYQYLVIGYSEGFKAKCNEWRLLSDVQRRSSQRKQEYLKRACQNGCVRPRLAQLLNLVAKL